MSLADRLNAVDRKVPGCAVAQVLARLNAEDHTLLVEALADKVGYTAQALVDALRAEGHLVGASTVKMHRSGRCSCDSR